MDNIDRLFIGIFLGTAAGTLIAIHVTLMKILDALIAMK